MGLTKNYLKYVPAGICNVIGSTWARIEVLPMGTLPGYKSSNMLVSVGACENVVVWDIRTGEKVRVLEGRSHMVTSIARNENGHFAVGYQNGSVTVFPLSAGESITFEGHKSSVACLAFDSAEGLRLASGGMDTDIVIWDLVNQRGICRLKGHKNVVTQVRFLVRKNIIISSSKDTLIKFWDLDTQHCFKTVSEFTAVVADFLLIRDSFVITGSGQEIKMWKLEFSEFDAVELPQKRHRLEQNDDNDGEDDQQQVRCTEVGPIPNLSGDDILSMSVSTGGNLFGFHGNNRKLAIYRIRSEEEVARRLKKRTKKLKKLAIEKKEDDSEIMATLTADDLVTKISIISASTKIHAFQCLELGQDKAKIVALLKNNSIESYQLDFKTDKPSVEVLVKFCLAGHRRDINTLCFSSDNSAVMSGSSESIRIWNRSSLQCIRSFNSGYTTSSAFVFGDKNVIVGTRSGHLEIYDIAAGSLEDKIDAHEGAVNSICLTTDKRGLASGGDDKQVLLWEFDYVLEESEDETKQSRKKVTVIPKKKVEMADKVLCVRYSNDMKYFVASLLNSKIYVFFADTMKLLWVLYDHEYAVPCIDISSDSTILISGSVDKSIHIYDLQFGQCLRFIKCAHDERINSVQFLPNTHMFFSSSDDKTIKQWDADTFQNIIVLRGHHNQVTCMTISSNGRFIASGAKDRSLRFWDKTDEILVLEEEQEMMWTSKGSFEGEVVKGVTEGGQSERETAVDEKEKEELVIPGEHNSEAVIVGSKNVKTETSADKIIEALDNLKIEDSAKQNLVPMLGVKGVLEVIKKIPSTELEEALLLLPFYYVQELLPLLARFIEEEAEVELPWRCVMLLVRVNIGQITSNQVLLPVLEKLRSLRILLKQEKAVINFNRCGLLFLKQMLEERDSVTLFSDVSQKLQERRSRKGRKRAVITIKS